MIKRILEIMMIAIIVAGVAGAYFRWMGALPISVTQTQKMSTFDASGEGKVVVIPDQATLNLGIQEEGFNLKQVQEAVNAKITKVSKSLKDLGISERDIKTTGYNYSPDYQNKGKFTAYASIQVVIKNLDVVSSAMDLVGTLGLNNVSGPSFGLSDSLLEKTTKEARTEAIDKAKKKAEELASLAGMRLGRIVNVVEGNVGRPIMYAQSALMMDKAAAPNTPTPIEPGTNEVQVNVTLSYETL